MNTLLHYYHIFLLFICVSQDFFFFFFTFIVVPISFILDMMLLNEYRNIVTFETFNQDGFNYRIVL